MRKKFKCPYSVIWLALALLCLPFSNAYVDRYFSIVNIVKDKLRNKLLIQNVDKILSIRFLLNNKNLFHLKICVKNLPVKCIVVI